MNPNPITADKPTSPPTSDDLEARIAAERNRLLLEQNLEVELEGQRQAPLEAGDDDALDRVEAQINASRDRQYRIQERIELLDKRLVQTKEAEHEASLDALAARADRAREIGERLITEDYRRQASALASTLARLAAFERFVEQSNEALGRAGRNAVNPPSLIRCRPPKTWTEAVKKMVPLSDPRHPYHGRAHQIHNRPEFSQVTGTNEVIDSFAEVDVVEERREGWVWEQPLHEVIVLPGVGPAEPNHALPEFWGRQLSRDIDVSTIAAELDAPAKPTKRKTAQEEA